MTRNSILSQARAAAAAFDLGAAAVEVRPYGHGLINDTFLVTTAARPPERVILQRINPRVFTEPERLMANLRVLLDHIARRQESRPLERDLRFPHLYWTRDGDHSVAGRDGALWRAMGYISDTRVFDTLTGNAQAAEVGFALGRFHELVRDLDPQRLLDTRPQFHNTPHYIARLDDAVAGGGDRLRPSAVQESLGFVEARRTGADRLENARGAGLLHTRTVHGDPKLNNFLFDRRSGAAVSLIDLDTVKPGLIHYDIGDCVRSCCNTVGESPGNDRPVAFNLAACRAILKNYLRESGADLGASEWDYIYEAIRLIPLELGIRFLTDYLDGDRYFKIDHAEHNLERALTQFALTARVEAAERRIRATICELAGSPR